MSYETRPVVAFLCLDHGLTLELDAESGIPSLAKALTERGWQVDLFTHTPPPPSSPTRSSSSAAEPFWPRAIAPHCRVLPLASTGTPAQVAEAIQRLQLKTGLVSPLFHTFDDTSAQVGAYLKQHKGWRWLHTPATDAILAHFPPADQEVVIDGLDMDTAPAIPISPVWQQQRWAMVAAQLSHLYRQHLALYVGARQVTLPTRCYLPEVESLSSVEPADTRWPTTASYSYSA